jgi:hypothetical protein
MGNMYEKVMKRRFIETLFWKHKLVHRSDVIFLQITKGECRHYSCDSKLKTGQSLF